MPDSLVDIVEAKLREDIVNGAHQSGDKLRVEELSRRYSTGATPVREALSRLLTTGLVEMLPNRGFRVPNMTQADLVDLSVTRGIIESEAARDALGNRSEAWELGLLSAMERLRRRAALDLEIVENRHAFFDADQTFHKALLSSCRLGRLLVVQTWLEQQQSRYYRQLPFSRSMGKQFVAEHQRLTDAALDGEADRLTTMLREHPLLTVKTFGMVFPS